MIIIRCQRIWLERRIERPRITKSEDRERD